MTHTPETPLGRRFFEALVKARAETVAWDDITDHDRACCERAAVIFTASLSHDETATAVIDAAREQGQPTSGNDREEIARPIHFMIGDGLSAEDAMKPTNDAHWEYWKDHPPHADAWKCADAIPARAQGPGPGEAVAWPETMPPDARGALELAFLKAKPLASHLAAPKLYQALRAAMIAATPTREA